MKEEYKDIFKDDKLNIQSDVVDFAHLIEQDIDISKVYSLNGRFGIGKTFFCDCLMQVLQKDGIRVAKLNIWEMDFYDNPLMPILSELNEIYKRDGESLPTKIVGVCKKLSKTGMLSAAECMANVMSAYLAKKMSEGTGDNITATDINLRKSVEKQFQDDNLYKEFQEYQEAITELQKCLSKWSKKEKKPIIVIIDELDRCRPDYAVQTLETLKHFFDIPGIVFVLAIDENQLECSVKTLFGTIDFDGYKRKFINNTFVLPNHNRKAFTDFLYERSKINSIIEQIQNNKKELVFKVNIYNVYCCSYDCSRYNDTREKNIVEEFNKTQTSEYIIKAYFTEYANLFNFSLRQMEQVFDRLVLFVKQISSSNELFSPDLTVFLICLHEFDKALYNEFQKETSALKESIVNRVINTYAKVVYGKDSENKIKHFNRKGLPALPKILYYSLDRTEQQVIFDNVDRFFCADKHLFLCENKALETNNLIVDEISEEAFQNKVKKFKAKYYKHMDFISQFE